MPSTILSIFFPERCRKCRAPGRALCARCINNIPLAASLPKGTYAVFEYGNALVQKTVWDLKYTRRSESARLLAHAAIPHIAEYMSTFLQSHASHSVVFIPIPEHPRKLRNRGYNQSMLLAKWWSIGFDNSIVSPVLKKTVFTLPQAGMNRHARMRNITNTMECPTTLDAALTYIIVDDVTTTGATFAEARRALIASGAKKIFSIALAHGYARK